LPAFPAAVNPTQHLSFSATIVVLCISTAPLSAALQGAEGLNPPPLISVSPDTSLRQLLALLAGHRLHRLHVLDGRSRPVGIVTITDLLRLIVGPNQLLEAYGPVRRAAW
jgi:CBS domain-containing protein